MKKVFITFATVIILLIGALVVVGKIDLNRLGKDTVYVQITDDGELEKKTLSSGEVLGIYWYKQTAYTASGEEIAIEFSAQKNLRHDAFLKLYVKDGNEVTSYEEVNMEDLPEKVRAKFRKSTAKGN